MAAKFNTPSKVVYTPRGITIWPTINSANEYGKRELKLHVAPDLAAEFEAELQPMLDQAFEEELARNKTPDKLIKADINKGTDEYGNVIFKFSNPDLDKDNNPTLIKVYNIKGDIEQSLGDVAGNGSVAIVKAFVYPYYMASSKTVGIAMRMNAVQFIEVKEFTPSEFSDQSGTQATEEAPSDDEF